MVSYVIMGYRKRVDANQAEIVKALREEGGSIAHIHSVGHGVPDILVGVEGLTIVGHFSKRRVRELLHAVHGLKIIEGANLLLELKDGTQVASKRKLTPDEEEFHANWKGQISIINNSEEAVNLIRGETDD